MSTVSQEFPQGAILENAVYNSIKHLDDVRYYQRRSGQEIDFILPKQGIALEVKERGTAMDRHVLTRISNSLGLKESYVISRDS